VDGRNENKRKRIIEVGRISNKVIDDVKQEN
jgi:hypothetical protein